MKYEMIHDRSKLYSGSCIITGIFKGLIFFPSTDYIDKISQGYITDFLKRHIFNGSTKHHVLLHDAPYFLNQQILLIGCGKQEEFNLNQYRKIIYKIINFCKTEFINHITLLLSELNINNCDNYWKVRHTVSLFNQCLYNFDYFKTNKNKLSYELNKLYIYIDNPNELQLCKDAISDGLIIAKGLNIAKDLSNMPPNYCTPVYLSNQVQKLSKKYDKLQTEILDSKQLQQLGMNAYLSVGKGSMYPALMPIIKYKGNPIHSTKETEFPYHPIVLIGKGLTFDSGGISIKLADHMDEMKYDMCGAAVVYAVMCIVAELNLPLDVIGILAVSENMISDKSLRPGDILTTLSGKTVEVINTDAEGRLVLCDVLTYAEKYNPSTVIDIATLTGACVIALGDHFSGLMSNNDELAMNLISASKQTMDYIWRLPLNKIFDKQLESNIADMVNIGGSSGSVITAACFLKKFTGKYDWAHLDIAGTAWSSKNRDKSSTGRPVELLSQFLINNSFSATNIK